MLASVALPAGLVVAPHTHVLSRGGIVRAHMEHSGWSVSKRLGNPLMPGRGRASPRPYVIFATTKQNKEGQLSGKRGSRTVGATRKNRGMRRAWSS